MFFLPTRQRPDEVTALIKAMEDCGDVPEVAVMIDDHPQVYEDVQWPHRWHIHQASGHIEMTAALNTLLAKYPGRQFYGFFGDHFRPLTPWSKQLEDAAGDWFMAWPSDSDRSHLQPSGAPTFGGKLIKELGWICLPTTKHVCTDRIWWLLWRELGIAKHVTDVKFTRTWPLGQGGVPRIHHGQDINGPDFAAWQHWRETESKQVIERIREAMIADGYEFKDGIVVGGTPFQEGW